MYHYIKIKEKKETLILFNLKNIYESYMSVYKYIDSEQEDDYEYHIYYKKQDEKQRNLAKEEILEKRNESLIFYDKIDQPENKELESAFLQIRLKVNFPNEPKVLRDGIFYTISQGNFIAYDSKFFKKLYVITNMPDDVPIFLIKSFLVQPT